MKLITRFELAAKDTQELHALFCETFNLLVSQTLEGHERANALASLQNIQNELAYRCIP